MITPEYLKRVTTDCPDLHVLALRLDRGLSTDKILNSIPGTFWDEERGLNDQQYIIPGAGGVGEILNNSYC
jgi:uracil phosphoribosyltransferase